MNGEMHQMQGEKKRRGSCPEGETSAPAFPLISHLPFSLFHSPAGLFLSLPLQPCFLTVVVVVVFVIIVSFLSDCFPFHSAWTISSIMTIIIIITQSAGAWGRSSVGEEKSGCFSLCFTCGFLSLLCLSVCVWSAAGEKFLKHSLILQTCLIYESPYCLLFLVMNDLPFLFFSFFPFCPFTCDNDSSLVQKREWECEFRSLSLVSYYQRSHKRTRREEKKKSEEGSVRRGFFFWTEKRTGCRCMQEVCVVPGMMMMAELRVFESVKKSCEESQSFLYSSQFHSLSLSLCLISHFMLPLISQKSATTTAKIHHSTTRQLRSLFLSISSCNFSSHCPSSHADERKEKVNIALKLPSLCNSFLSSTFASLLSSPSAFFVHQTIECRHREREERVEKTR